MTLVFILRYFWKIILFKDCLIFKFEENSVFLSFYRIVKTQLYFHSYSSPNESDLAIHLFVASLWLFIRDREHSYLNSVYPSR